LIFIRDAARRNPGQITLISVTHSATWPRSSTKIGGLSSIEEGCRDGRLDPARLR
jgi:hypothetical protein